MLQSAYVIHQETFSILSYKNDRVDRFSNQFIERDKSFSNLSTLTVFVLVMAHVQSPTKHGYNVSKSMLVENLEETFINS